MGLTKRQADLLAFIKSELDRDMPAPSYTEMACHLGLASLSGINRLVKGLETRGLIRRIAGCARSVTIVSDGPKPGTVPVALPEFTYRRAEASAAAQGVPVSELVAALILEATRPRPGASAGAAAVDRQALARVVHAAPSPERITLHTAKDVS